MISDNSLRVNGGKTFLLLAYHQPEEASGRVAASNMIERAQQKATKEEWSSPSLFSDSV
jgi:predicted ATPase